MKLSLDRNVRQQIDEDEAREIARTLNEDRRAMPKAERLPVVQALREEGHSPAAIAGAVGVTRQQVAKDLAQGATGCILSDRVRGLDGKTYPATRPSVDKTREAVSKRREQIAKLASEGHTAEQIGRVIGTSREAVRVAAKRAELERSWRERGNGLNPRRSHHSL